MCHYSKTSAPLLSETLHHSTKICSTEDYKKACRITDEWKELLVSLQEKVIQLAKEEKLMKRDEKYPRAISSLSPIMEKYGYQNKQGWWVRISNE